MQVQIKLDKALLVLVNKKLKTKWLNDNKLDGEYPRQLERLPKIAKSMEANNCSLTALSLYNNRRLGQRFDLDEEEELQDEQELGHHATQRIGHQHTPILNKLDLLNHRAELQAHVVLRSFMCHCVCV